MSEEEPRPKQPLTQNENFLRFVFPIVILGGVFVCIGWNTVISWIDQKYTNRDIAKNWGMGGLIASVQESDVRADEDHGAISSVNGYDAASIIPSDAIEDVTISGQGVKKCVRINTPRWYPKHYDPTRPEVQTASEAMLQLAAIGYLGDEVIIKQGDQIRVVSVGSTELDSLANLTEICSTK